MVVVLAVLLGFAFGAADQYLGSRVMLGPWAASVSVMSAPWLCLPFLFGWTQTRATRAMLVGAVVTSSAVAGYFAMTLSPVENVPLAQAPHFLPYLVRSQIATIVGGAVTGPVFGWLGYRWRVARSWMSAALVVGALCLEPVARNASGRLSPPMLVWRLEVLAGVAVALGFLLVRVRGRARTV